MCKKVNPWKTCLISRCQSEFERYARDEQTLIEILEQVDSAENKKEKEEYLDLHFKYRHRAHGTIRFIGELFLYNLLTSNIMRHCIDSLLSSITEENITRLCYLLTTVGQKLEERITAELSREERQKKGDVGKQVVSGYIKKLEPLKNAHCITTSRVRFEIMNVLELRKANWKPRENAKGNAKIKTLDELKEENRQDLLKRQAQLNDYQSSQNYRGYNNNNNRQHQNQRSKQQNYYHHNSKGSQSSFGLDFKKINTKPSSREQISLAPQKGLYDRDPVLPSSSLMFQPTKTSNAYGNLNVDCDDQEQLPSVHHSRSSSSKGVKKEKTGAQPQQEYKRTPRPARIRTPSPDPASFPDIDSYFTIELSDEEIVVKANMEKKIKAFHHGGMTIKMITTDLNLMNITGATLAMVYNDFLEKGQDERNTMAAACVDLLKNNVLSKSLNSEALSMVLQLIPTVISDVPRICDYIGQFFGKFLLKF